MIAILVLAVLALVVWVALRAHRARRESAALREADALRTEALQRSDRVKDALGSSEFVVNSVNDMVSMIDQDGVYRMVNDAWCRNTGLSREQVVGRPGMEVVPKVVTPERIAAVRECFEHRQPRVLRAIVDTETWAQAKPVIS